MDITKLDRGELQQLLLKYEEKTGISVDELDREKGVGADHHTQEDRQIFGTSDGQMKWEEPENEEDLDVDTLWLRMCMDGAL